MNEAPTNIAITTQPKDNINQSNTENHRIQKNEDNQSSTKAPEGKTPKGRPRIYDIGIIPLPHNVDYFKESLC